MLNKDILDAVAGYAASMTRNVTLVLQRGEHDKRSELEAFLTAVAGVSERIRLEERETHGTLQSGLSFLLEADGEDTGIRFSGIPGGHEFNSFVLALLHAGGVATKLDAGVQQLIARSRACQVSI
jgi:alkyl hydroperoxide reductase subunit F